MNMSNKSELQTEVKHPPAKRRALEVMADRMSVDPTKLLETLKNTCFKGATDVEMLALVVVANTYSLNPLLKEIYAFPGKGGGIVPVVGIDGWIKLMNSADSFDGIEFEFAEADGKLVSCTATIHTKNRSHAVKVTEFLSECFRATEPWKQMPRRMLRHKALIQASRVAFGFSGIYDEDEAKDQARVIDVSAPKFDQPKTFLEKPAAEAPTVEEKPAEKAPAKEATPSSATPAPTDTRPEPDGSKTKIFNRICQEHKLEIGDVLAYLGDIGHPSFEDCPPRYVETVVNHPAQFASQVRFFKGVA